MSDKEYCECNHCQVKDCPITKIKERLRKENFEFKLLGGEKTFSYSYLLRIFDEVFNK